MSVSIRPAAPADAAEIFAMVRELAAYEALSHAVDATEEGLAQALFGSDPRAFCDVADADGGAAGFALWFYSFSTFRGRHGIYLEDLFVRPAFRRRGIASALLGRLAARCREERLGRLEWAVLDWNRPAIALYERLGAVAMDEWTVYRVERDALARLAGR